MGDFSCGHIHPAPRVVHPLPSAPDFLGRETELEQLRSFWDDGGRGVLALVGLGGAGKTALAARFLSGPRHPQGGLFVWSFYQEPDAGLFLRELFDYFSVDETETAPAKGAGLLHLLSDALQEGGPHLLVLDGLERVQRQEGASGGFGQIEDPLLKGLLVRIAEGLGRTAVLVTSRFPLTDLTPWHGSGYRNVEVCELTLPAALALLRRRGVHGDDATLTALVESYGCARPDAGSSGQPHRAVSRRRSLRAPRGAVADDTIGRSAISSSGALADRV